MTCKILQLLFISYLFVQIECTLNMECPSIEMKVYNPCCGMPCLHSGVCTPKSTSDFECDCSRGYYGKNCNQASLVTRIWEKMKPKEKTKQQFALTGKLFWAFVNAIPFIHDRVLQHVYEYGSDFGTSNNIWADINEYTTFTAYFNRSSVIRGLPPVPCECPTPLGIKGPRKLPDIDRLFELVFRRTEFKPCPQGSNLIFAAFAQHITHQFFTESETATGYRTNDITDVSQIYGADEITRKALRSMLKGKLKTSLINGEEYPPYLVDVPEVEMVYPQEEVKTFRPVIKIDRVAPKWAMGHKLFSMSPLMFVMSTIWLREHNRVSEIISKEHPDWSDERIYQTTRLIILGELLTITGSEYVQHVSQFKFKFSFKPELMHESHVHAPTRTQEEFNLLFHWHQTIPDVFRVSDKTYNLTNLLFSNNRIIFAHGLDAIVDAMSRSPAGEITYQNSGEAVRTATKNLIAEGRRLRLHSFNTYRRFFNLKPYTSFMELVEDDKVAEALEELYGDIEALEFIVGVLIEKHIGSVVSPSTISLGGPLAIKEIIWNPIGSPALWRPSTFGGKIGFDIVKKANLKSLFCLNMKGKCKNNVWMAFKTPTKIHIKTKKQIKERQRRKRKLRSDF